MVTASTFVCLVEALLDMNPVCALVRRRERFADFLRLREFGAAS